MGVSCCLDPHFAPLLRSSSYLWPCLRGWDFVKAMEGEINGLLSRIESWIERRTERFYPRFYSYTGPLSPLMFWAVTAMVAFSYAAAVEFHAYVPRSAVL